ncbi:MAG: carboxypeptidase-like regulatory domain-containing protein [Chitinophagaceae bacterium]|nr:MAG: carboxypeptidase-like regulatory domain-containing protein [Chitinophagaceae bacterium]
MKQAWTNKALFLLFPFLTVSGMYIANREEAPPSPDNSKTSLISGTVVDAATNKPLINTHVYIIHGEEEDITDEKGAFSIRATGAFPLTLNAEHSGYLKSKLRITAGGQQSLVKLSPK